MVKLIIYVIGLLAVMGAFTSGFLAIIATLAIDIIILAIYANAYENKPIEVQNALSIRLIIAAAIGYIIGAIMMFAGMNLTETVKVISDEWCGICGGTKWFCGEVCKNCYGSGHELTAVEVRSTWIDNAGYLITVSSIAFFFVGKRTYN